MTRNFSLRVMSEKVAKNTTAAGLGPRRPLMRRENVDLEDQTPDAGTAPPGARMAMLIRELINRCNMIFSNRDSAIGWVSVRMHVAKVKCH